MCQMNSRSLLLMPCWLIQVSIDKAGHNVLLKDTTEQGLVRGIEQIYKK